MRAKFLRERKNPNKCIAVNFEKGKYLCSDSKVCRILAQLFYYFSGFYPVLPLVKPFKMSVSQSGGEGMQQIDLTKLAFPQLTQLKNQLDSELGVVQDSLQTLKRAQVKFQDSKESLDKITPKSQGNPIMVPLTDSMYVEGKIANADKVIVDIGTGFYVEKSIPDAQDYFKRRVAFVTQQMEKLQFIGTEKMKIREAIIEVMEMKLQALQAQKKAAAAVSGSSS
uniref:Prefoldin subunit 5 n=2 Tax=Cacopsylla melanoneura TaxID=428564 RepID=A0A8D9B4D6_9HEMI